MQISHNSSSTVFIKGITDILIKIGRKERDKDFQEELLICARNQKGHPAKGIHTVAGNTLQYRDTNKGLCHANRDLQSIEL